jgi:hypothetical protein
MTASPNVSNASSKAGIGDRILIDGAAAHLVCALALAAGCGGQFK